MLYCAVYSARGARGVSIYMIYHTRNNLSRVYTASSVKPGKCNSWQADSRPTPPLLRPLRKALLRALIPCVGRYMSILLGRLAYSSWCLRPRRAHYPSSGSFVTRQFHQLLFPSAIVMQPKSVTLRSLIRRPPSALMPERCKLGVCIRPVPCVLGLLGVGPVRLPYSSRRLISMAPLRAVGGEGTDKVSIQAGIISDKVHGDEPLLWHRE